MLIQRLNGEAAGEKTTRAATGEDAEVVDVGASPSRGGGGEHSGLVRLGLLRDSAAMEAIFKPAQHSQANPARLNERMECSQSRADFANICRW